MAASNEDLSRIGFDATRINPGNSSNGSLQPIDRLRLLYPMVNEDETPLPRSWSPKDKYNYIGLSQNNLRVHYKGYGKTHKDAASVRTTHPIPAACGLYYFEVKIVSKGRDGYMGIGLSAHGVNVNRLPGWDKHSYGYHGDDGHSFCSSGTGQPYGPTFTTGDVIGCGVNLVDNTAFYTKNGHHLGIAFTDLPPNLYPTVGLQTPGEVVDANFGQQPFVFDIGDMINELRVRTRFQIINYPTPDHGQGQWQAVLHKMVSTYLVHHGYYATAEAFAGSTGQVIEEGYNFIKNRQRILKLVLAGRMGEAIELTSRLYPSLLERDPDLLFALKCRQFVEMVNGTDSEVIASQQQGGCVGQSNQSQVQNGTSTSSSNASSVTVANGQSANITVQSDLQNNLTMALSMSDATNQCPSQNNGNNQNLNFNLPNSPSQIPNIQNSTANPPNGVNTNIIQNNASNASNATNTSNGNLPNSMIQNNQSSNQTSVIQSTKTYVRHGEGEAVPVNGADIHNGQIVEDVDMEETSVINGGTKTNGYINGYDCSNGEDVDMEIDSTAQQTQNLPNGTDRAKKVLCGGNKQTIEKVLEFGRQLYSQSLHLRQQHGKNEHNKKMLQDAFSLLAYANPWNSPVGWQLDPQQRETVCARLNSAILGLTNLPRRPPLEMAACHARELVRLMSSAGLGACGFAVVDNIIQY